MSEFEDRLRRILQGKKEDADRSQAFSDLKSQLNHQRIRQVEAHKQQFEYSVWQFARVYIQEIRCEEYLKSMSKIIGGKSKVLIGSHMFAYSYKTGPEGDPDFHYGGAENKVAGAMLVLDDTSALKRGIFIGLCATKKYGFGKGNGLNMFTVRYGSNSTYFDDRKYKFPSNTHYPENCLVLPENELNIIKPSIDGSISDYYNFMDNACRLENIQQTRSAIESELERITNRYF